MQEGPNRTREWNDAAQILPGGVRRRATTVRSIRRSPSNHQGRPTRSTWVADDGTVVHLRPMWPEDAQLTMEFVKSLSAQTRYLRFMGGVHELSPDMLERFTHVDYGRDMAIVALLPERSNERFIAVCRYATDQSGDWCEFAIVVCDDWQHRGLGRHLLAQLIDIAREQGFNTMWGDILTVNDRMLALVRSLGFTLSTSAGERAVTRATLVLDGTL